MYGWVAELFFKVKQISPLLQVEDGIALDIFFFLCHGRRNLEKSTNITT